MNAIEYVKKNGIEKSKIHLDRMKQERWINSFFNDLKQIVEAWELVESSIDYKFNKSRALEILEIDDSKLTLIQIEFKRAINLVESCHES